MAKQTSVKAEIKFGVKFDTNIPSHQRWINWMSGPEFPQEIAKRWKQASHLHRLVQLGRSVIEERIYKISKGEGKIAESVSAQFLQGGVDGSLTGTAVFLDPSISGATGPVSGMDVSTVSYAAFFERPEFNSFLLGAGNDVMNPIKHRPFFDEWTIAFFEHEEKEHLRSIAAAMKYKMPRPREDL